MAARYAGMRPKIIVIWVRHLQTEASFTHVNSLPGLERQTYDTASPHWADGHVRQLRS